MTTIRHPRLTVTASTVYRMDQLERAALKLEISLTLWAKKRTTGVLIDGAEHSRLVRNAADIRQREHRALRMRGLV